MKVLPRLRWRVLVSACFSVAILLGSVPSAAAAVTLPPGSIAVPSSGTFLYMNSEPGDYIGQGIEQLYRSEDSTIRGSFAQDGAGSSPR